MQNKFFKKLRRTRNLGLFFKGVAMGAADVVPGVSGGTIAFISGIYEELIDALKSADLNALKLLLSGNIKAAWLHINGNFLAVLFAGIFTSVLSMAHLVSWLLDQHPTILWAYFFGLILASIFMLIKQVDLRQWRNCIIMLFGLWVAFEITVMTTLSITNYSWWVIIACGALAICAMILPGISGSFILLLLGMYEPILQAIKIFDVSIISLFILGCVVGLLSFSRILAWLLHHYHQLTLAILTGFTIGSLNKVWPWKDHQLIDGILQEINISPISYQIINQLDVLAWLVICFALIIGGFTIISINCVGNAEIKG